MTTKYLAYAYAEEVGPKLNDVLESYQERFETNEDGIADRPIGEVLTEVFDHLCDTVFPGYIEDGWMSKSYNWYKKHEDEIAELAASLYEPKAEEEAEEIKTIPEEE